MAKTDKTKTEEINTKQQILFSAKNEFAEKGYDGARMGSIARRAKVNQALIHYYFRNKENLFAEVLHRLFGIELADKIQEKVDKIVDAHHMNPPEKLYIFIYLFVIAHLEAYDDDFKKILAREMTDQRKQIKSLIHKYLIPRHESVVAIISEGIAAGDFSTKNPLYAVLMFTNFVHAYVFNKEMLEGTEFYNRLYGERHKEEVLNFLIENTFKALRPENGELKIPVIPQEIIRELDNLIELIKKESKWDIIKP